MGCQEENTFLRYGDTPSLDNAGFVKVASSHDQLENMSLEDKERIVASVALLDSFSESLSNKLNNLVQNITPKIDDQELEDKVTDLINTLNANNNTESLDIKQVFALQRLNSLELKWITPNYSKPYKVRVFKNTRPSYARATLLGVVNHTQDYRTILESEIGTDEKVYFFVRAYDGETQGANSPITSFDGKDWLDSLIKMLRGKITETLLSRELIDSIYTGFGNKLNNEIEKTLQQARNSVIESERTINNVITQLRGSIDQELVSVKGQLQDQGTDIQTLERKSEGLAEQITRISAVADNAIAGIQEERIARATENEAFARETNTRIAQTNNAIATVRDDLKVQTDNYQSLTQKVEDYKNIYDQNEVRTTQKFEQIANENEATQRTLRDTTAKTESATVKIRDLEEAKATSDRATAKRFSSLRSSINGSHFPNYNFEGELEGWTSHEGNTLTFKRIEDPSAPVPDVVEITGNMPMWIYSNEPTKIEIHKTYTLTAIVKSPTGLKSAKLVMMCYDKNKNLIRNIQTEPNYPLIEEQRNKGSQWVKLSGKITEHSTTYPTTDRDKIPLHAVYATPALILESAIGGHFWVTQLDMQDTSQEENNLALINETKETLNTDRQSTALKFSEMETKFRDTESNIQGVAGQVEQVKSDVKKIDGRVVAEAEKAEQLTARVGRNEGAVQSLTRVINDEKSSTATKLEEMKSSFRRDLSNVIQNPDFLETRVTTTLNEQGQAIVTGSEEVPSHKDWNVAPPNKVRVITYDQNPITEHKTKFPSKYYLKTWANSVSPLNALSVSPNDKIYVSLGVYAQAATIPTEVYIRYSDKDNNLVSQHKLGSVSSRQTVKLSDTLTVPENATKAELVIFTGRDNLAESTGYTLISKPELRMNMAAIYADAKIEEAKLTIANENEALAQKVERLTADHNETKASVQREVNARAEKDNAITSEIETMKTSLEGANAEIVSIKATQVTDKQASAKALEQLSTDFNKKIGDLDTKSSSAIKSASDTFNDATKALTQKVDTQKSEFDGAIKRVEGKTDSVTEIASKATSDISEIKTTINELDRSVATRTQRLESNFNTTITEKINQIEVGGRNLLRNTKAFTPMWGGYKHPNEPVLPILENGVYTLGGQTTNYKEIRQIARQGVNTGNSHSDTLALLQLGKEYTISFDAKLSDDSIGSVNVNVGFRSYGVRNGNTTPNQTFRNSVTIDSKSWKRYTTTIKLPNTLNHEHNNWWFLLTAYNNDPNKVEIKLLKLEEGNKASSWTPAPEDIEQALTDANSKITLASEEIVTAKSNIGRLEQAVNDANKSMAEEKKTIEAEFTKVTKKVEAATDDLGKKIKTATDLATDANSSIDRLQQTINTVQGSVARDISSLNSTFTQTLTEKTTELNNKLANIKVGGKNLLWFSEVDSTKRNYWHGTRHANSSTVLTNADGNLIVNFNDTSNLWTQWQQYGYTNGNWVVNTDLSKLEGGQEYTFSFKVLNETGKSISIKAVIARDVTSGSRLDGFVQEVIVPPSTNSEWFNASVTGTLSSSMPNNYRGNRFLVLFQNANSGTLKLKNLQLEKGNIQTDWEMSQHDLDTLIEDSVSPVRTIAVEAKSSVNTLQQAINDAKGAHATLAYSLDARYRATKEETKREAVSEAQTLANNAKREAINEADKLATSAKDSAIATASTDATNKANQAVQQAINWQIITARTDLNTLTNQGKFFIRFTSNPNAPITNHIYVSVDKAADNRITQSIQADNNPTLKYTRYWNGSTWTDWVKEPTTAEVQEVKTKVDNLKIGGRNYLIATDTFGGWKENVTTWHYAKHQSEPTTRIEPIVDPSLNGTSSITGREFKYLTLKKESAQGIFAHWYQVARMGSFAASSNASPSLARVQIGKEYTLSFEAKNANTGTQPLLYIFREHKTSGFYNVTRQTINIDSQDWKRYSVTFTLNLDSAGLIALNYFTSIFEMTGVGEVHIRKPMLEEGNLPSDWVLAPEDTQLSLNEFAVSFDTYKGSVANDRLALGRQLEQITASLNSSANLVFDSEFSDGLAEQLDKEAGAITGYHRSILGDGRNTTLDAKMPVGFNVGYVGDPNSNANSYKYFTTCEVPVVPGIYQLSIYIRNESNTTATCYVGLLDSNRSGISIPSGAYKDLTSRTVSSVEPKTTSYSLSDFTRVVFNVDLSSVANLSYIRLTSRLNYITTNSPTNFIYFTKPMISKVSSKDAGIVEYSPGPNRGSIKANIKNVETALATETQARVQIERDLTTNFQNSTAGRKIQEVATSTANSATAQYNEVLMARISGASGANLLPDPTFKQFLSNGELRYYLPYKNGAGNTLFNFEVIPNVGLQGSNAIRCSWDNTTTSTTKGFYLRTISNRLSSIPSNPTELQLTSLLPYHRFYNPNQEVIVAVAARVPTGVTPSGTLTLSACNAPYFDNSSITYLKRPNLTNEWQWFVMRGKKTANPNATRDDEYFITIAQQTQATTAIEFCLPYVSPGSEWVEYKSPDYSSSLVNTYAQISSTREIAVDAQGKVKAKIGLTVDSNGRVTGWQAEEGLTNAQKAQQSSFTIFADKFKITTSSLTDPKTPFSIDSTSGKIKFNGEVEFSNVLSPPSIPKTITVVGTSNYVPPTERYPYIQIDDTKVVTGRSRGLTITILHKDTFEVLSTKVHDTYTANGCSTFLTDLNQKRTSLGENILILHSFDASINNANLITALNGISTSVGSTIEKALTERVHTSFALIYQKVGNDTVLSYNVNSSMPNNVAVMATHYKGKLLAPSSPMPTTLAEISRIAQEKADSKDQLIADAKKAGTDANTRAVNAESNAKTYADTKKTEAIATAANDATNKANAAKSSAISEAAKDATTKAGNAKREAISSASSDATTKANQAKADAISAASSDATTKANKAKQDAISESSTLITNQINNLELVKLISAQGAHNNNSAWVKINNQVINYTASEGIVLIVFNMTDLSTYFTNVYANNESGVNSLNTYLSSTTLNNKIACIISRCNVPVSIVTDNFRNAFRRAGSTDLIYKALKEKTNNTFALIGKIGSNGSAYEAVVSVGATQIYGDLASVTANWVKGDLKSNDSTMIDGGRVVTNTITSSHIMVNSLEGDRIKVNTLEGNKIKVNTLEGSHIKANTLTVDKLAFNPGAVNLLINSQLMPKNPAVLSGEVPFGWATYQTVPINSSWLLRSGKTDKSQYDWGSGETERYIFADANANQYSSGWIHAIAQDITLGSGFYCFSFYATNHGGNANDINCLIENINSSGGYVSQKAISTQHEIFGSGNFSKGYHNSRRYWVTFEVKSTDTYNRFRCGVFINNYATRQGLFFGRPMLEQVTSLNSKPSPFQHSSTRLDPNHLYVPNLSSLSANLGSITGGSLNINSRFLVNSDGTIRIGGKAHGVVIDSNGMRVYDGGNLKVRIGNLANNISGD